MPKFNRSDSFSPHSVSALERLWRRITFRPFKQYKLYMIRPDNVPNDRIGCDDEVIAVTRLTTMPIVSLEVIYNDLLNLHNYEFGGGLINALWGSDLHVVEAYVDADNIARIELEGTLAAREKCSVPRIQSQLTEPAKQVRSGTGFVRSAAVVVNGRPLEELLSA